MHFVTSKLHISCPLVPIVQYVHAGLGGGFCANPVGLSLGLDVVGMRLRRNALNVRRVVSQSIAAKNAITAALLIPLITCFIGASTNQWNRFMLQRIMRGTRFLGFEMCISVLNVGAKCSARMWEQRHRGILQHHHPAPILQRNIHEPKLHRKHYAIRHSIKMMFFLLVCCLSTGAAMNDKDDAESISSSTIRWFLWFCQDKDWCIPAHKALVKVIYPSPTQQALQLLRHATQSDTEVRHTETSNFLSCF